jgi:primase-polymerase (primpol)-like protein
MADINRRYVGVIAPKEQRSYSIATLSGDDDKLIERILKSRQSQKFEKLFSGDTGAYASHSQADSAFVWLLAFWTRDRQQIDRIFRSSGLYRDKWNRRLYNTTYGESIMDNALGSVRAHRELEMGG